MTADAPGGVGSPLRPLSRAEHAKRGTTYDVFGYAELQTAAPVAEGTTLAVYRGDDGKLWVRPEVEFCDGRFSFGLPRTALAHPAPATEGATDAELDAAYDTFCNARFPSSPRETLRAVLDGFVAGRRKCQS